MKKSVLYIFSAFLLASCQHEQPATTARVTSQQKEAVVVMRQDDKTVVRKDSVVVCSKTGRSEENNSTKRKKFKGVVDDTLSLGDAKLCVPAEGLKKEAVLSITPLDSASLPAVPAGLANVTAGGGGYRFLPHGEHFKRFAKVVIPFDSVRIPKGYTAKDIRTYYYDEQAQKWTVLPKDSIDVEKQVASALTTHFTDMINGIITVPETPEAQGYAPTTISDIKAADPSAGILPVQAPQPNNNGTASLQIPFNFPKGRAGMGPNVSVTYSSEGGSSWCGYGWSVNTPCITIDTRWGVPRYNAKTETESYLFNGEQFTERTYRGDFAGKPREANKRFYLRRETDFAEIVRKGDAPTNYYWELRHLDGLVDIYKAEEKDEKGNIAKWCLAKTTDAHGNCVTYSYEKANGTAYIKSINYTGFGDEKGAYTLRFNKDKERKDITSNGRNGFMQFDKQLLASIDVLLNEQVIRSYQFNYKYGEAGKTLLSAVAETDGNGTELYKNQFKYHASLSNGGMFEKESVEYTDQAKSKNFFEKIVDGFEGTTSLINGASSSGFSVQGGLNIGVGITKALTPYGGGTFIYNYSESNGETTLADMDGDGLNDIVYHTSGFGGASDIVSYRKNLYALTGTMSFSDRIIVKGISSFANTVTESHTTGEVAGVKAGPVDLSTSFLQEHGDTRTRVYMQDFNSDGLIDVADKGTVMFSHINDKGEVVFENHSGNTPNPIQGTGPVVASAEIGDTAKIRDSLEKKFPLLDVVRMWRAPFDGEIRIASELRVCDSTKDGIRYALQVKDAVKESVRLDAGEKKTVNKEYKVSAGDLVFFRLQSNYSGTNDQTEWAPSITYDTVYGGSTLENENHIDMKTYSAEKDFLPVPHSKTTVVGLSDVTITNSLRKGRLSEDVVLKCFRNDSILIYSDTLKAAEEYSKPKKDILYSETVAENDSVYYSFEIEHTTQIDHRKISWLPIVNLTNHKGGTAYNEERFISPSRIYYNKVIRLKEPVTLSFDTTDGIRYKDDTLTLTTHLVPEASNAKMAVKYFDGGIVPDDTLQLLRSANGQKVFVSFYSPVELDNVDSAYIAFHRIRIDSTFNEKDSIWEYTEADTVVAKVDASVYSKFNVSTLGNLYNGWGQFAVNGSNPEEAIDLKKMEECLHQYDNIEFDENNKVKSGHSFNVSESYLQFMIYDAKRNIYNMNGNMAYIDATGGCPTRMCNPEIVVDVPIFKPAKHAVMAPYICHTSFTKSDNASVGTGNGKVGVGGGYSESSTSSEKTVLDMNGDRYPDWIAGGKGGFATQYTESDGCISHTLFTKTDFGMDQQNSTAYSVGLSVGTGSDTKAQTEVTNGKGIRKIIKNLIIVNQESEQTGASFGASGNFSKTTGTSLCEWIDINGDGLPDMVYNQGGVAYNTGYGFATGYKVPNQYDIAKTQSKQFGAGLTFGVNIEKYANIGEGVNFTYTSNKGETQMCDLNGDGLPDIVSFNDDHLEALCFNGSAYTKYEIGNIHANRSKSVGKGAHMNLAIPLDIPIMFINLHITPYFNYSNNTCVCKTTSTLTDMNGDGLPDLVVSHDDSQLEVFYNRMGKSNLLDTVITPMGAKIVLQYERTLNSYKMPHCKYVLNSVEVRGGNKENGATCSHTSIKYEGGVYDRYEREFLGFSKVTVKQHDTQHKDSVYRYNVLSFSNKRIIEKGLLLADSTFGADGELLSANTNTYQPVVNNGSEFLALVKTEKEVFTGGNAMTVTEDFTYDEIGNVTAYTSTAGDVVDVKVRYCDKPYLRRIPVKVNVSGGATRERACTVNDKGDITQITLANGDHPSVFDFEHDAYGNISKVTRPKNAQGQRLWSKFVYDGVTHSLVTEVSNAYGYKASTEYDCRFAVPVKTTDINGQTIDYSYDDFGRLTKVRSPYDDDYTIKMVYDGDKATTNNHTMEGDIVTTTTCDNLMRPVKVEKTAVVDGKPGKVATGVVTFDAFGRVVREYLPTLDGSVSAGYSQTSYDAHDRKTEVVAPDGSTTKMAYEVVDGGIKTTVTDPENHVSEQYTDARGRTVKTVRKGGSEDITVEYRFNPLGELLAVTHPNGLQTRYTYDQLGNKLSVDNPDAGLTRFTYDAVGNLTSKTTPNLAQIADGGFIKYVYDYERLSEVQYPVNVTNRVQYTYGESGDKNNCAGRIKLVQDASGGTEFAYGKLGEVTKTIRSVMLSTSDVRTYVSEFSYDSWNRIRQMKYPDGEVLTYGYDAAGQLISMVSKKDNTRYTLLADMKYDQYGNVTYKKYGNGTESNYTYDPKRQHLTSMVATNSQGEFINAAYTYDKVDNILGIRNTAKPLSTIGGTYSHSYTYDDFSRLVSASGKCGKGVSYQLNMEYDIMSNPLRKKQTVKGSAVATSHDLEFTYDGDKPNAASKIGNESYTYDLNGNPTLIEGDTTYREMVWNEENRLMILSDADYVSRYTYDYTGNRVIKSHGPMTTIYINGVLQGVDMHDDENYTLYVSPYLTVNADRFTKYYYAGTQRIASKLGSGKFDNVYGVNSFHLTAGNNDYAERSVQMVKGVQDYYKQAGVTPGVPNQQGQHANPYISGVAYPNVPLGDYSVPSGWPGPVARRQPGQVFGPPVSFLREAPQEAKAGVGFKPDYQREGNLFYFHTDHLGSTSYLTDTAGNVSQFVWYAPYGESLVDEHTTTYENPFKFSGKELDDITGLYDHGARNRNPITAVWYGIDELFEKSPENGPYGYCGGNPVKYFDPDGRDRYIFNEDGTFARVIYKEEGEHYGYIEGKNIKFKFADPENDPQLVESVNFQGIHFVTDEEIDNALWNSGVYSKKNQDNKYSYTLNESSVSNPKGTGKMDYKYTANFKRGKYPETLDINDIEVLNGGGFIDDNELYLTKIGSDSYAHNKSNFGNFLWGAGMKALGFYLCTSKMGAHWNNFFHDVEPYTLDSDDDQKSIELGFKWNNTGFKWGGR